jgi:hypothetical protein
MATTYSNDNALHKVADITAAKTVKEEETGTWFTLNAATGATVTLPSLGYGLRYRFIVGAAFATANWVIDSAEGDNITGNLVVAGAAVPAAAEDQINFVNSAETVGDFIEIFADMNNSQWIVWGVGNSAGSITATDPS